MYRMKIGRPIVVASDCFLTSETISILPWAVSPVILICLTVISDRVILTHVRKFRSLILTTQDFLYLFVVI